MLVCINVRTCVVGHGDVVGGRAEGGFAGGLGFVGVPGCHDEGWVERMAERAVRERAREVDYGGFLGGGGGMADDDRE